MGKSLGKRPLGVQRSSWEYHEDES